MVHIEVHHIVNALKFARAFAATRDVRYYLNGVHVDVDPVESKLRLTGTDGHRFGRITLDVRAPDDFEPFIIPLDRADAFLKITKPKKSDTYTVPLSDSTVGELAFTPIEGKYPDCDVMFDRVTSADRKEGERTGINFSYLEDACKAAKHVGNKKFGAWSMTFSGANHPMLLELDSPEYFNAAALIMPVKL